LSLVENSERVRDNKRGLYIEQSQERELSFNVTIQIF